MPKNKAALSDIRSDIEQEIRSNPELQEKMALAGLDPKTMSMDDFDRFLDREHITLRKDLKVAMEKRAEIEARIDGISAEADIALSSQKKLNSDEAVTQDKLAKNLEEQQALLDEMEAKQLDLENAIGERARMNEIHDENIAALTPGELGRFTRFTDLREEMRDFMGDHHGDQITFTADQNGNVKFYATNAEGVTTRITQPHLVEQLNEQLSSPEGEALVNRYVRITGNMTEAEHRAARSALNVERADAKVDRIGTETAELKDRISTASAGIEDRSEELTAKGIDAQREEEIKQSETFADYSAQRSAALAAGEEFEVGSFDWSGLLDKVGATTDTARTWLTDRFSSVADLIYTKNTLEEQLAADKARLEELQQELDELTYKEQEAAERLEEAKATLEAVEEDMLPQYNEDGLPVADQFGNANHPLGPEVVARVHGNAVQAVIEAQEECDRIAEEKAATEVAVAEAKTEVDVSEMEVAVTEAETAAVAEEVTAGSRGSRVNSRTRNTFSRSIRARK